MLKYTRNYFHVKETKIFYIRLKSWGKGALEKMAGFISPSNVQSGRGFVPPPPTPPERKFFITAEPFELLR